MSQELTLREPKRWDFKEIWYAILNYPSADKEAVDIFFEEMKTFIPPEILDEVFHLIMNYRPNGATWTVPAPVVLAFQQGIENGNYDDFLSELRAACGAKGQD